MDVTEQSGTKLNIFSPGASWAPKYFFFMGPAESLGAQPVFMPINVNLICYIVKSQIYPYLSPFIPSVQYFEK
jgi:hypothetical protein